MDDLSPMPRMGFCAVVFLRQYWRGCPCPYPLRCTGPGGRLRKPFGFVDTRVGGGGFLRSSHCYRTFLQEFQLPGKGDSSQCGGLVQVGDTADKVYETSFDVYYGLPEYFLFCCCDGPGYRIERFCNGCPCHCDVCVDSLFHGKDVQTEGRYGRVLNSL